MWAWFHKFGSPRFYYGFAGKLLPWLAVPCVILFAVGVITVVDYASRQTVLCGALQAIGLRVVAHDCLNFRVELAAFDGIDDGLQIATAAGDQNDQRERVAHMDLFM